MLTAYTILLPCFHSISWTCSYLRRANIKHHSTWRTISFRSGKLDDVSGTCHVVHQTRFGYSTETRPPVSWPNEGSLTIKDLSLVYFEGGPRILKNINVHVSSKEKVGVVGCTGAGKSSLVSALFRMPDPLGKVMKRCSTQVFQIIGTKGHSLEQGIKETGLLLFYYAL